MNFVDIMTNIVIPVIAGLGTIATAVVSIVAGSESKSKKVAKVFELIENLAKEAVVKAESFPDFNGVEKKEVAMCEVKQGLVESGISTKLYSDEMISAAIEDKVRLSRLVNSDEAKKNEQKLIDEKAKEEVKPEEVKEMKSLTSIK